MQSGRDRSAAFRPQKRPPAATVPNHPNASPQPLVGESENTVRKFARPLQDARFCGLKAALRLNSYGLGSWVEAFYETV